MNYFSYSRLFNIRAKRELKFAEPYWKGESTQVKFLAKAQAVDTSSWQAKLMQGFHL
ncbi:hypothetical protein [Acinetobacter sp. F16]|uniref:hypothetical protein n=1 Tax=Acinetobacter sp. F16 TaxID=3462438 RepID=UPI004046E560